MILENCLIGCIYTSAAYVYLGLIMLAPHHNKLLHNIYLSERNKLIGKNGKAKESLCSRIFITPQHIIVISDDEF